MSDATKYFGDWEPATLPRAPRGLKPLSANGKFAFSACIRPIHQEVVVCNET